MNVSALCKPPRRDHRKTCMTVARVGPTHRSIERTLGHVGCSPNCAIVEAPAQLTAFYAAPAAPPTSRVAMPAYQGGASSSTIDFARATRGGAQTPAP
jgi:hypothetical protein